MKTLTDITFYTQIKTKADISMLCKRFSPAAGRSFRRGMLSYYTYHHSVYVRIKGNHILGYKKENYEYWRIPYINISKIKEINNTNFSMTIKKVNWNENCNL